MSEQRIKSTNQVRILTKVQYGRAVAQVRLGFWPFYKHADQKMLQASLAEVYRGGVVLSTYGDKKGLQAYSAMETKAQGKKECMFCGPKSLTKGSEAKSPYFTIPEPLQEYLKVPPEIQETYESFTSTQLAYAGVACGVSFLMGVRVGRIRPVWRAYRDVTEISNSAIGPDSPFLQGRAVRISDGDTIRFWHTPTMFSAKSPPKDAKVSQVALPIRICTIDTPETAKFGKPGQKFGVEAKEYLSEFLENRNIQVQILTKDQYGRAVAQIRTGFWPFYKYADQQMLQAGLAEIYRGGGAVYGDKGLEAYSAMETKARKKKQGMWSQGGKRESAAEYKARTKGD